MTDDKASATTAVTSSTEEVKPAATEATAGEPDEATVEGLVERLHFFFSDANLRQDVFLRKLVTTGDHSVSIETLLKFNTIKQYTTDLAVVKKVIETKLDQLKLAANGTTVSRVIPFVMSQMDDNIPLSLVVSNLPLVDKNSTSNKDDKYNKRYGVTIGEVKALFECYGTVALVKLRFGRDFNNDEEDHNVKEDDNAGGARQKKKPRMYPLGSALVEFETVESLQKAAADTVTMTATAKVGDDEGEADKSGENDGNEAAAAASTIVVETNVVPKRSLELRDQALQVTLLADFIQIRKSKKSQGDDNGKRDRKRSKPESDHGNEPDDAENAEDATQTAFEIDWKPGCVIRLEGLNKETCDREAILAGESNKRRVQLVTNLVFELSAHAVPFDFVSAKQLPLRWEPQSMTFAMFESTTWIFLGDKVRHARFLLVVAYKKHANSDEPRPCLTP
jgi:La domain